MKILFLARHSTTKNGTWRPVVQTAGCLSWWCFCGAKAGPKCVHLWRKHPSHAYLRAKVSHLKGSPCWARSKILGTFGSMAISIGFHWYTCAMCIAFPTHRRLNQPAAQALQKSQQSEESSLRTSGDGWGGYGDRSCFGTPKKVIFNPSTTASSVTNTNFTNF
jgi:hypothetical protein